MKIYQVTWRIEGAGEYVPLGPVGEGDYHGDRYGLDIVTAPSLTVVREVMKKARPKFARFESYGKEKPNVAQPENRTTQIPVRLYDPGHGASGSA